MYLLTHRILDNNGTIVERKLESLKEMYGEYDIILNCTGLGAKKLCNDVNVLPIRGQVIKIKCLLLNYLRFVRRILWCFYSLIYNTINKKKIIGKPFVFVTITKMKNFEPVLIKNRIVCIISLFMR